MLENSASASATYGEQTIEVIAREPRVVVDQSVDKNKVPTPQHLLRRIWRHPRLMHYHRLFAVVALINIAILALGAGQSAWWFQNGVALDVLANLVVANFFVAIVIRQQYVINGLFWLATRAPTSWPLAIRWTLGKVYHFGGLHTGCATAGTLWFGFFTGAVLIESRNASSGISVELVAVSIALLVLLCGLIALALPPFRARFHNGFEVAHRFGGWAALVLFWTQTVLFVRDQHVGEPIGSLLLSSPSVWLLIAITFSIALPWLRLKKVPVQIKKPSNHAVLVKFDHGVTPFAGSSTPVSRNPLFEWHSFANVPSPHEEGFRLTISRAGDWTGKFIDDTPSHVWVKGVPTAGVGNIDVLFKRVVWIATGSGIGPCLPHLLSGQVPAHLVWSTRDPRKTYGDELVDEILAVQPNAVIWNTQEQGRPDLVALAHQAYREFDAEAVICIANQKLTWEVVYGMESRGIPAYGAIWDS